MARRVPTDFSKLPEETYEGLVRSKGMTATGAYNKMKRLRCPIVTPIAKIREMARQRSKGRSIRTMVTEKLGSRHRQANATTTCIGYGREAPCTVRLHPMLRYHTKEHVRGVIDHELDHVKVMRGGKAQYGVAHLATRPMGHNPPYFCGKCREWHFKGAEEYARHLHRREE